MRYLRFLTLAAAAIALGVTPVPSVSWAASGFDPFNTEARTAPAPNQPWIPDQPLPKVPAAGATRAVPDELSGPVSLAQLTDLALRLNAKTRQAWLQARAEAATLGMERADEWPQIDALLSHNLGRAVSSTAGTPSSVQTRYGPNVTLSYVLFDFGQRAADIEAANYRLLAANLAQNRVLQEVAFQVEQAYYRVLAFDYLVRASRESLKNFETALDAAQRRRSSGLATAGDEYRAETQVGQARLVLTRNDGERSKARGQLANAVGLPVNITLQLQAVSETPPVSEITQSMEVLLEKAKSNRPDLIAAEARARAARASSTAVSRAGLPTVEFVSNYGRTLFTDSRTEQDTYNFGLNVRIPLFSGFRDTYSKRRAQEVADQAETTRDQLYNQTELEVWQSYFDLQTSASSVSSTANLVKSAGESAAAATARYKAGVGSLLDFITAQLDDTNARVQQIQSYLDWYSALARLNFALGASDATILRTTRP
ncbi:MAG: TolC family protein [Sulfuricaulis sp.]|nr:TolC family protein [Sulfuricaulis sp.]